ncbi:type III PLP-dependent enzyme [Acuticoccus sp. I52.16.1]|uniref:type III PLP-dependent enzyme n=1 Tax=Acuticoccus sp. I52.16.1 TaxID=2928472 RepID=UPI001FD3A5AC|nr:type III PLP-dependent enzyme [Acuticoccus sp. I52.16.1]UOM35001.1 type III PLP-dependent enzyme [Acuticoccus sp. I52.16.1]
MTDRIMNFLRERRPEGPCLVVDLEVVRENYLRFAKAMPDSRIFYAVKANPAPEILALLAELGSNFDCASVQEIDMALAAGATPNRVSFGNTIKKERDVAAAHARGVTMFAVDCEAEVDKVARAAPGARVYCRILCDGEGAEWALSRKFGCEPQMAIDVLDHAHRSGLVAYGVSFHVGSQQKNPRAWDQALESSAEIFRTLGNRGIELKMVNLGGGFATRYLEDIPEEGEYGHEINASIRAHFGNRLPETIIEPGRGMVGNAGILKAEVVLVSQKAESDIRWVYIDAGKFNGLAETMDEAIRYPIQSSRHGEAIPCILAGPTCDSVDVMYEKTPYPLPVNLEIGDELFIGGTGAYTTTYASVAFNGFPPLASYVI